MSKDIAIVKHVESTQKTMRSYIVGFVLSLLFTFTAYILVEVHLHARSSLIHDVLIPILAVLAFAQFLVQLIFFLHLRAETKPRWKLFVLLSMISVVIILVAGSLWIMNNLNTRMMLSQQQINTYMNDQDGL